jgi:hypothetical protein
MHMFTAAARGEGVGILGPQALQATTPRAADEGRMVLYNKKFLHVLTRTADVVGLGDNYLCLLQKPR